MEVELAAGFMIATKQPHRYNILFFDNKAQQELQKELEMLQQKWKEFYWNKILNRTGESSQQNYEQQRNLLFEEFSKLEIYINTFSKIDRIRYWESGKYEIVLRVKTANPSNEFITRFFFTLDESNSKLLSYNTMEILQTSCSVGSGNWNFAYCSYDKKD